MPLSIGGPWFEPDPAVREYFLYAESHQFPFWFFSTVLSGEVVYWPMAIAVAMILLAPGVLLVIALAFIPLFEPVSQPDTSSQTANP